MRSAGKFKKAFTLIELLVVISIIALLLSIIVPSLGRAKEVAKRVICGSNQSSVVKGVFAYSANYNGKLPVSGNNGGDDLYNKTDGTGSNSVNAPWAGTVAYMIDPSQPFGSHYLAANALTALGSDKVSSGVWGMGKLYETGIIEEAEVFYCPAVPKSTREQVANAGNDYCYRYEKHIDSSGRWPWNTNKYWPQMVPSSFYYNPLSKVKTSWGTSKMAARASELNSSAIMGFDMILAQGYMPHRRKSSGGVNAYYADGHVGFRNNKEAFDYIFDEARWLDSRNNFNANALDYETFLNLLR